MVSNGIVVFAEKTNHHTHTDNCYAKGGGLICEEESEEPIYIEKPESEAVTVTSYDDLKAAIENDTEYIIISGTIDFPENGILEIKSNIYILGKDDAKLNCSEGDCFFINSCMATFENLTATANGGSVFCIEDNASVNIVSGTYSANDDVVRGRGVLKSLWW